MGLSSPWWGLMVNPNMNQRFLGSKGTLYKGQLRDVVIKRISSDGQDDQ